MKWSRFVATTIMAVTIASGVVVAQERGKDVEKLIVDLDSDSPAVRDQATKALIEIGKPAVAPLQKSLARGDADVAWRVRHIVSMIEVRERTVFSGKFLRVAPNIHESLALATASGKMQILDEIVKGPNKQSMTKDDHVAFVGEILIDGGKGLSAEQKRRLIDTVPWMPAASAHVAKLITDEDNGVCAKALNCLGRHPVAEAIPALSQLLADTNRPPEIYVLGMSIARNLKARELAPRIAKLIGHNNDGVRQLAMLIMGEFSARDAVDDIRKILDDGDDDNTIYCALTVLGNIGVPEAIPSIKQILKHSTSGIRDRALVTLEKIGGETTLPDIRDALKDLDDNVRLTAIRLLSKYPSKASLTDVRLLLQDGFPGVRVEAARLLRKISPEEAIPDLVRLLDDEVLGNEACLLLIESGAAKQVPKEAVEKVMALLGGSCESARRTTSALLRVGMSREEIEMDERRQRDILLVKTFERAIKGLEEQKEEMRKMKNALESIQRTLDK